MTGRIPSQAGIRSPAGVAVYGMRQDVFFLPQVSLGGFSVSTPQEQSWAAATALTQAEEQVRGRGCPACPARGILGMGFKTSEERGEVGNPVLRVGGLC